jgi:hypothetical protein
VSRIDTIIMHFRSPSALLVDCLDSLPLDERAALCYHVLERQPLDPLPVLRRLGSAQKLRFKTHSPGRWHLITGYLNEMGWYSVALNTEASA